MFQQKTTLYSKQIALYIFLGLLAYIPFHILISTYIGVQIGGFELMKILKDIILIVGFVAALIALLAESKFFKIFQDRIVWLIGVYAVLTLALPFFRRPEFQAEVVGIVYNLRFFVFFVYAMSLTLLFTDNIKRLATRIALYAGVIVASFGVIQYFFLPERFFSALGYSKANGVLPAFYLDDKPNLHRIMSSVRYSNSLGSYFIFISALLLSGLTKFKKLVSRKRYIYGFIVTTLAIFLTFSRSALLGFIVSCATFIGLYISKRFGLFLWIKKHKTILLIIPLSAILLFAGYNSIKNTYLFKNVVFHADESTVIEDPNELRVIFWKQAVKDIERNPVGYGPGSAGFASIKNIKQKVIFTENYYLQVGMEVGVVGLLLFSAIELTIIYRLIRLYFSTNNLVVLALIASFAGLALSNAFAHIWFNEAVAYTWWGLAGLYALQKPKVKES